MRTCGPWARIWPNGFARCSDPLLAAVRGRGLWLGLVLSQPIAARFEAAAREPGFSSTPSRPAVVRLAPPLVVTDAELDGFAERVPRDRTSGGTGA